LVRETKNNKLLARTELEEFAFFINFTFYHFAVYRFHFMLSSFKSIETGFFFEMLTVPLKLLSLPAFVQMQGC